MLKITCVNGKVLDVQFIRTLFQNITNDSSFQNFKFKCVKRAKITICNNAVTWTNKAIGCVKNRFEDDSHKDILQTACKVLNSWTVMEETPKESMTRFGCEMEHFEENNDNGNDEQNDDYNEQSDDDNGKHCDNNNKNDVNSAEDSFCFTEVDSSINLLTKQCENLLLNTDVQISSLKMEYKIISKKPWETENMDYIAIRRSIFRFGSCWSD